MSDVIEISSETVHTLKKLHQINQSLRIVGGNKTLKTINEQKTLAASVDIEEEFPRDFCVYDLNELISVLSIVSEPVIDLSNNKFTIISSKDGSQKLKYVDTDPEMVSSYFEKEFSLKNEDIQIDVSEANLKAIMKAASTLSLEYVGFRGDGERVYMTTFNRRTDSDDQETNSFTVDVGETEYTFDLFYKSKILSVLDGDSHFTFASSKKSKLSRIECGKMTYWAALDANSSVVEE